MRLAKSASLVAMVLTSLAQAQDTSLGNRLPPSAGQMVNILYSNPSNVELGVDDALFNTCFASSYAVGQYAYMTFSPKNATINFYKDTECKEFTFGLDGYYNGHLGPAGSFRWVGWSEDSIGMVFDKEPIQGQGEAAHDGGAVVPVTPAPVTPGTGGGGVAPQEPQPGAETPHNGQTGNDSNPSISYASTFFGGALGTLVVLSLGGVVFWKTAGKKLVDDSKGKSVLPYNRVSDDGADQDEDILLKSRSRSHNMFELADEDDDSEEEEDEDAQEGGHSEGSGSEAGRRPLQQAHTHDEAQVRLVEQERYQDDEPV